MLYAGIGSRQTPPAILAQMRLIGEQTADAGWTLRSGAAIGADIAFEAGCLISTAPSYRHIYTPNSHLDWEPLYRHASLYHPNWAAICQKGEYVKKLMARNSAIICGPDLHTPVHHIICWTPGGAITGGTGQALRIAQHLNIPVLNLATHTLRSIDFTSIESSPIQLPLPLGGTP
jgi:hypothetical protein